MKPTCVTFIVILLAMSSRVGAEVSQDGVWTDVAQNTVSTTGTRSIVPQRYRLLALDRTVLTRLLATAPHEDARTPGVEIALPLPDGGFERFRVVESPIMEPGLATKFPELKTYLGTGMDDRTASLRFSVTPKGFHAQALSANGARYIDPYQSGDTRHHISYSRRDYNKSASNADAICHVNDIPRTKSQLGMTSILPLIVRSGTQRRIYRTVIAATGEYTAFHGGTIPLAQAAIVVALNRVNGIYERDVAVRMVLVANNDAVIYTNGATDPYPNDDREKMLAKNQENLDAVIGSANYDIGHVFSTGRGGKGEFDGPCNNNIKAQGVTGSPAPTGDPFYIDLVAHEIGHQFGAHHTFNGNAGSCANARTDETAYEPGSGSTIMGYAGICSPQDLQNNSHADFHSISIEEIVNFTTGAGDTCAARMDTGNTPPTVDAGPNRIPAFTIPRNTPFSLTGTASDVNGDALTYDWEEFDLGPTGAPNSPSGNAPIFRSFPPSTSRVRTFPQLTDLLNNTQTIGELLPNYARNLIFRLTMRDGVGGVNQDAISLTVSGTAGPFQVTAPNTAVKWISNSKETVTWNVAYTNVAPVNCSSVHISLSVDGGRTFPMVLVAATPNDGSQVITVPTIVTTQARLKIACANNIFFDISNTNFRILPPFLQYFGQS